MPSPDPKPQTKVSAALVSVGGSPAPVLHVLSTYKPKHVWYLCSSGSRNIADDIQAQLDWHPAPRFIEVERFEELGPCYATLRRRIIEILKETRVDPASVLVDYTSGTKTMSAALVLAAVELFSQFSYVGGEQREKGGLGVTIDGREKVLYQDNPWEELAVREVDRACDLWRAGHYEAVANLLKRVAPKVAMKNRFFALADLAAATAARHRLDFKEASVFIHRARGRLQTMFEGRTRESPLAFVDEMDEVSSSCQKGQASETLLRELLDNALRTAEQGRYEDAAARLYRSMEMQGQLWLAEATEGLFQNGRCSAEHSEAIPESLQALPFCRPDDSGDIRLSLEQCFQALAALGHERARIIADDIQLGKKSRWRQATEKRNTSILAHGTQPIGKDGFEEMKTLAREFLGFDLSTQRNPIPPLDPAWFQ